MAEAPHGAGLVMIYYNININQCLIGGERGIRTLDRVTPVLPFQGSDLNRSSSSPRGITYLKGVNYITSILHCGLCTLN